MPVRGDMSGGTLSCLSFASAATLLNHGESADATKMSHWHISDYSCHAGAFCARKAYQEAWPAVSWMLQHGAELHPAGF